MPSFDLGKNKVNGSAEDLWFTSSSSNGAAASNGKDAVVTPAGPVASPPAVEEAPTSPESQSVTVFSDGDRDALAATADEGMYRNGELIQ